MAACCERNEDHHSQGGTVIYGIGIDLVEMGRTAKLLEKYGERFAKRVLTQIERQEFTASRQPAAFLAQSFAAKEAFAKAVGSGFRYPVILSHISVAHDGLGKPELHFHPELERYLKEHNIGRHHLSLSDENNLACAMVILERS
jgi:holo-[acyl-carrier protein] synthase